MRNFVRATNLYKTAIISCGVYQMTNNTSHLGKPPFGLFLGIVALSTFDRFLINA